MKTGSPNKNIAQMKPTKYQHIVRLKYDEPETPKFCLIYTTLGHYRTLRTPTTVQSPFFFLFFFVVFGFVF